ncbi:tetratricopeptide repeat protein [bacterium]|nr:tetratricopeptide repeat protein [bacterium]NUN45101.1 tetratricopeptide repeat protein [bacterium]
MKSRFDFFIIVLCVCGVVTLSAQSAADLVQQANEKFSSAGSEKEYKEAAGIYEKAAAADSTLAIAWAGLAKSHAMIGNIASLNYKDDLKIKHYKESAKYASKAGKLDKENSDVQTALAMVYRQLSQRDNLMRVAQKAVALDPKNAEAYDLWADAYSEDYFPKNANIDSSILIRKKAVEANPNFAKGYRGLGDDYASKGDLEQAESYFTKAIAINPQHAGSHDRLGRLYYLQGEFEKAKTEFNTAIKLDPRSTFAYTHLADVLADEGNFKEAFLKFTYAVDLNPNAAYAHASLSWMYLTAKDKSFRNVGKAIEYGAMAAELTNNTNPEFLAVAAEAYYEASFNKSELRDSATNRLKMALSIEPDNFEYQETLGRMNAKEKSREYVYAWKRGERLLRHNRINDAINEFITSEEKNDKFVPNLISYAKALKKKGDEATMKVYLEKARKADKAGKYTALISSVQ